MTRLLLVYLVMTVAYAFLRNPVGQAMNHVLGGLITTLHVPLFITILLLSVITGSYSSLLLNRFVDQDQVKQSQAKMREFQKVYREAQLAGDQGKLKKLEKERAEVMELEHGRSSTDHETYAIHTNNLAATVRLAKLHNGERRFMADKRTNYDDVSPFWNTGVHSRRHLDFSCLACLVLRLLTRFYSSHSQDFGDVTGGILVMINKDFSVLPCILTVVFKKTVTIPSSTMIKSGFLVLAAQIEQHSLQRGCVSVRLNRRA